MKFKIPTDDEINQVKLQMLLIENLSEKEKDELRKLSTETIRNIYQQFMENKDERDGRRGEK